jgi:hypothetical protein
MNCSRILRISAFLILLSASCLVFAQGTSSDSQGTPNFALVELFTSQGCSSCPSADRLLAKLEEQGRPGVYLLSYHVKYWDYLGWQDPYGQAEFADRQRDYTSKLRDRTYTPQMVVNGTRTFVGSNATAAHQSIETALKTDALHGLEISVTRAGDHLEVDYRLTGPQKPSLVLNLAVVARKLGNEVKRGENRGRSLNHVNVVMNLKKQKTGRKDKGHVTLPYPSELDEENVRVVAFLQHPDQLNVVAAADARPNTPLN